MWHGVALLHRAVAWSATEVGRRPSAHVCRTNAGWFDGFPRLLACLRCLDDNFDRLLPSKTAVAATRGTGMSPSHEQEWKCQLPKESIYRRVNATKQAARHLPGTMYVPSLTRSL